MLQDTGAEGAPSSFDLRHVLRILQQADPASALFQRCSQLLNGRLEIEPPIPKATPPLGPRFLTIGMATYDDYDGCYFTIQSIRLHHPEILNDVEFLVIDNNPTGRCAKSLKALESWIPNYRYIPYRNSHGTAVRDLIFREAPGEFVLSIDCHVMFPTGALARLLDYCRNHPDSIDLLQGPLLSDAAEVTATQFNPTWSHGMYGVWGMDERGRNVDAPPFDVPMQGCGVLACRRLAWPGYNPRLAGFGGEEGYVHEKIRRAGGRNLCLPFLRWLHRFERPMGVPYRAEWFDRIRNYLLIQKELGLDPTPVIDHFIEFLGSEAQNLIEAAQTEIAGPFQFFDGIYCINLDRQTDRWSALQPRLKRLGIERRVRRFPAAETPLNHHIGCALSHRRIIAEAKQQGLETILVLEDDVRFTADAVDVLAHSLSELNGQNWQLLYLGGYISPNTLFDVPGCPHLSMPTQITCTHAIAYHHSVYDAILEAVPDNAIDVAIWVSKHLAIDQLYTYELKPTSFVTCPVIASQDSILSEETRVFEP